MDCLQSAFILNNKIILCLLRYSHLSQRQTPLGLVLGVHLREMSIL